MEKFTVQKIIGEALKDFPVANYFVNTYDKAEERNTLSWLKIIDKNNMDILNDYSKMLVQDKNTSEIDDVDLSTIFPENTIEAFAMLDFTALVLMLIEFEGNDTCSKDVLSNHDVLAIEEASIAMSIIITFEAMRRHGTATIEGNGKITDFRGKNGTRIVLTELGKRFSDSINTMRQISEMMEEG